MPNASNLVRGDEVRAAGFRVGVVDTIKPATEVVRGRVVPIAVANVKLDKVVQPLPVDTEVIVRPRSSLGLKYIELTLGHSARGFVAGATVPLSRATLPVEFDDLLNTFDDQTRASSRVVTAGYGDALAGRGSSLNTALEGLNPFFHFLPPVMRNLSAPRTGLRSLFRNVGAVSAQLAPVARVQAELFGRMADVLDAVARCPSCLQDTIAKNPPTQDVA